MITAVIVDINFTADILLGLSDIKRIKLFRYLPECVENNDSLCDADRIGGNELLAKSVEFDPIVRTINYSDELSNNRSIGKVYNSNVESIILLRMVHRLSEGGNRYIETDNEIRKAGVWGEQWTEEERIRRG